MKRTLITGSIAYDILLGYEGSFADAIRKSSLEKLSVGFVAPHFARHRGGTGANIAWNLMLLSGSPLLVSTVGDDGGEYVELLSGQGIDTDFVEQMEGHATATAIVGTDDKENQITFFHPGADAHGSWPNLDSVSGDIAYAIVSPRDVALMMRAVEWCAEKKVPFLFDPGQQMMAFSDDELRRVLKSCSGVIVNAYEWNLLSERIGCTEENIALYSPLLIVTRGEHGLTMFTEGGAQDIGPCTPSKIVNPTGAGDAFRGGFLRGVSAGWSLLDACRLGAAMGSFAVEWEGTLMDSLDIGEARKRVQEAYDEELPTGM